MYTSSELRAKALKALANHNSKEFHEVMMDLAYVDEKAYDKLYEQWVLRYGKEN